ncbi:MAG: CDP-alcohol phosphatidyltransferase family protein, partial [Fimbriimonadaceae bacterium]|nr:CDP-alcohol phosphatidyltransferase family protein [Alphaproteobacteria bacterium]
FLIAGISDGVDGFIAKQFNQQTALGAYLDPLADKSLLVSIYVALGLQAEIPAWLVIMVVSRDLAIVAAVMLSWMLDRAVTMHPLFVSKVNTTGQIVLAAIVLGGLGFELELLQFRFLAVIVVAALTVVSLVAYLVVWLQHMANDNGAAAGEDGS